MYFSCGPTRKLHDNINLKEACLHRSHRSTSARDKIKEILFLVRKALNLPKNYEVILINGSATAAVECALWNLLGSRPVNTIVFDTFSKRWMEDVIKLKLPHVPIIYDSNLNFDDFKSVIFKQVNSRYDLVFTHTATANGLYWCDENVLLNHQGLKICDATSAAFIADIPWQMLDAVAFSFAKVLGAEGGIGCLILNSSCDYINNFSTIPTPRFMQLSEMSISEMKNGYTLNTISMLVIEDILFALRMYISNGGRKWAKNRAIENQALLVNCLSECDMLSVSTNDFVPQITFATPKWNLLRQKINYSFSEKHEQWQFLNFIEQKANKMQVYDISGHSSENPCWRFWTGPTLPASEVKQGAMLFKQCFEKYFADFTLFK